MRFSLCLTNRIFYSSHYALWKSYTKKNATQLTCLGKNLHNTPFFLGSTFQFVVLSRSMGTLYSSFSAKLSTTSATESSMSRDGGSANGREQNVKDAEGEEKWRQTLTPQQYHVTREGGTDPPFTGEYYDHHECGLYKCVCCGAQLFSSTTKYDSGSGWPSFTDVISDKAITTKSDHSLRGHERTEVMCRNCQSHLGHVFPDGPSPPQHLRYCINDSALTFQHHHHSSLRSGTSNGGETSSDPPAERT